VLDLIRARTSKAPPLVSVAPAAAVRQALNLMHTWEVSQIPVMDGERCVGGLIEGNLMLHALEQPALLERPVREVMEPAFPVLEADTPAEHLGPLLSRETPAALVRENGKVLGIVSRYDLLQELIATR
jgi:cystathionine beta-synthase